MYTEIISERLKPEPFASAQDALNFSKSHFLDLTYEEKNLANSKLIRSALKVLETYEDRLVLIPRWSNFGLPFGTDTNVAAHSYRQTIIDTICSDMDYHIFGSLGDRESLIAGSLIHDIGELIKGDKADVSKTMKDEVDESQAALSLLDSCNISKAQKDNLKQIYKNVVTSSSLDLHWQKMHSMFRLYERYGYTITGFQQMDVLPTVVDLPSSDFNVLDSWTDPDFREAVKKGDKLPENLLRHLLIKFTNKRDLPNYDNNPGLPSLFILYNELIHIINKRFFGQHKTYQEGYDGKAPVCPVCPVLKDKILQSRF